MITDEMIRRAKEVAEELYYDYEIVGVRVQDEIPFELGPMDHVSKVWVDEEETEEELDGVSIICADKGERAKVYFGDYVAIIAGNRYTWGEDDGEIVLEDPVVIEVLA